MNAHLYRRDWPGSSPTLVEKVYYVAAVVSVCIGWFFNTRYVFTYPADASWTHFTMMLFDNPASGSTGQDMIITNVVLFPLWTIIDGGRRGLRAAWIYFVMSLLPASASPWRCIWRRKSARCAGSRRTRHENRMSASCDFDVEVPEHPTFLPGYGAAYEVAEALHQMGTAVTRVAA